MSNTGYSMVQSNLKWEMYREMHKYSAADIFIVRKNLQTCIHADENAINVGYGTKKYFPN